MDWIWPALLIVAFFGVVVWFIAAVKTFSRRRKNRWEGQR